jgi:CRP-like cAMP-binding protein
MIATELLEKYGAVKKFFNKSDVVFEEGNLATYYYQIISGEIKMSNYNDDGRECIQGIF